MPGQFGAEQVFSQTYLPGFAADKMYKNRVVAETIRATAYFLWEQEGRPEGRSAYYWLRAKEMHMRQLAYDRWLAEGTPVGRAEAHWLDVASEIDKEG